MDEDYDTFFYPDNEDEGLYEPVLESSLPPVPPRNNRLPPVPTDYDTFFYPDNEDEGLYEPVLESSLSPVPPRNNRLPPVPTRREAPLFAPPQISELNYEDLDEVKQPPSIPKLPRRNSPSFREVPQRSKSPLPDVPQRVPPPIPDTPLRIPQHVPDAPQRAPLPVPDAGEVPELNYEDLSGYEDKPFQGGLLSQRRPHPIPDVPQRIQPPVPDAPQRAPLPVPDAGEVPELNYEDLSGYEDRPPPRFPDAPQRVPLPVPDAGEKPFQGGPLSQRKACPFPQFEFEEESKRNIPGIGSNSQVNPSMLDALRKNLKKRDSHSQMVSPTPQFPIRPEVAVKTQSSPVKPLIPKKPQVSAKPFKCKPANEKASTISEKITTLNLDSTDGRHNQTPGRISPCNTFNKKNSAPPPVKVFPGSNFESKNTAPPRVFPPKNTAPPPLVKVSPGSNFESKNTEDISEEDSDSQEEYVDAAEVKSLHYQPYYYESFNKSLEKKIFNEDTEAPPPVKMFPGSNFESKNTDGTFVVRKSRAKNSSHPYTILVYYDSRSFRLKIRFEDDEYAIGEKKDDENKFPSVVELVEHYTTTPLMLIGAGSTQLKLPPEHL